MIFPAPVSHARQWHRCTFIDFSREYPSCRRYGQSAARWKTAIKSAVPFLIPMYMYVRGILSCVYLPPHLPSISFHFQLTYPLRNCSSKSTVDNTIVLASPKVTSCPYKVSGNRHKGSNNSLRTRPNTMTFKLPSILARPSAFAFLFDWFCRWDI